MTIRPMERHDVPAVVKIIWSHDDFDGKCAQRYYDAFFSDANRNQSSREQNLVAVDDASGEVAGVCGISPDKCDTPEILWLTWFYVRSQSRGAGIGQALLRHTLAVARELEARKVYLDTSSDPIYERSIQVYEKVGFQTEGDLKDYYDEGESLVCMGLDLQKYVESLPG